MAVDRVALREKLFVTNDYGYVHQNPNAVLSPEEIAFAKKEWNINTELHRTCVNCQIRHLLKYENTPDPETQEKITTFTVPCEGIPKSMPKGSGELLQQMIEVQGIEPARAKLLLQSTQDPVAWAELMFGFNDSDPNWHLRPYQKEQLRCSSQRIVIREGRRTGKTFIIALKLLYLVFNRIVKLGRDAEGKDIEGGPLVLIVTPYQSQLLNVFNEMEKLVKRNLDLIAETVTASGASMYVKTPFFHMDFKNGAKISGFVSGVGTKIDGSGGGTMRGQSAHVIYLDEMDMIPEETIEKVIMPILLTDTAGNVIFIVTSTPIGKRGRFYKMCLEDPYFKEDYLPSTVLPQWNKMKRDLTVNETPESIQQEYMAAFIDGNYGVFKPSFVYRARKDYTYEDTFQFSFWKKTYGIADSKQFIRCIGIDWNKNAGTEFVVITYIPHVHRYVISEAINIPAGEFSALRWREELIRLNYKWKPDYIYADEGYGHTIIEDLKLIAFSLMQKPNKTLQDVETVKLTERLKAYNFSSKITLRNPVDGTMFEKAGKEFLVENAQRIFEDPGPTGGGIIFFPESDNQLKDELLHYAVMRRSVTTGKAVYGTESDRIGDHRLDAMMLALAGIQIEAGLYSDANIPASRPVYLPKDLLDKREELSTPGEQFVRFLGKQQTTAPGALSILQTMREGETAEQAASRNNRGARIPRRTRGNVEESNPVMEFFKKAPDYSGYDSDREKPATPSAARIIKGRGDRDRTIRPRGR